LPKYWAIKSLIWIKTRFLIPNEGLLEASEGILPYVANEVFSYPGA
jgi:hypothetical protein